MNNRRSGIVVLWPDEQNYARFREISDGIKAATVETYRAAIAADLESKQRAGIQIAKMPFDVDELERFAHSRGSDRVTSEIRATFAALLKGRADGKA